MNSIFRFFSISVVLAMVFTFPYTVQCDDWLPPYIARAVCASIDSENIDKLSESSVNTQQALDHSPQVTRQPLSVLIDNPEIIAIMHVCSEAAGITP